MQETKEKELTYDEFINNILETRGRFACEDEYHERHHITPKCMGGANEEDNLIDLFAREHFEAHRLLALENPDIPGLTHAWWCMCQCPGSSKKRDEVTPEEYEEVRKEAIKLLVGDKNPMYGKHHTEESKKKNSESHRGKTASAETRNKLSKAHKGRSFSPNHRKKAAEAHKNPIICVDNYVVYKSATDAEIDTGISHSHILAVCRFKKEHKTAGGFIWRYLYDQTCKDGIIIPGAITLGFITEEEALAQLNTQQND